MSGARIRVALSTSCLYPATVDQGFATASRLGFDGVEVMVTTEPSTQSASALRRLMDGHELPVVALHAPTLLITQRVWGSQPWPKIDRSVELAAQIGAGVVVVHPPFRWQRGYAEEFVEGVARRERESGVAIAVENMYPWRAVGREIQAYRPHFDPAGQGFAAMTLDFSHAATAGEDSAQLARRMGSGLAHVHLGDGSGSNRDEHLVPGHGRQPCAEVLEYLTASGYAGDVVVEVGTRGRTPQERDYDLAESLAFARLHLAGSAP